MRRIIPVKSQETLKSDIFCLKRQLALIIDENQLLKVKIRRLENELQRKDKYIECFHTSPKKDRQVRRFLYDNGASMIYKLQKRNQQLESILLERDLHNEKRYNDIKTMCLYGHIDCKANRRGSGTNVVRQNSGIGSHGSLNKITSQKRFDSKKPDRLRSSSSLQSVDHEENAKKRYCISSRGDSTFQHRDSTDGKSTNVINILQSEKIVDKRTIISKNAEISRLAAELKEIKSLLRLREDSKVAKSTSTTQLENRQIGQNASRECPNFIEMNKRNVSRSRGNRNDGKSLRKIIQYSEVDCKKLPTVDEQNEEITLPNECCRTISDINYHKHTSGSNRPKTRIEYVFDSEVSSDGEEFCLPNNLRNFLQQAVNTMSKEGESIIISD